MRVEGAVGNRLADAAERYAQLAWHVLPVHGIVDGRCTCVKGEACSSAGKHPRISDWQNQATTNEATIRRWWKMWPDANIGIVAGKSSLIVLDVDARHGGEDSLDELIAEHGALPKTREQITGGDGRHILFTHPGGHIQNRQDQSALAPGIDIKADGGFFVAAPSLHISGNRYQWDGLEDEGVAAPPAWLKQLLVSKPTSQPTTNGKPKHPAGSETFSAGQRHGALASFAGKLRRAGCGAEGMLPALLEFNRNHCSPPKTETEVRKLAEDFPQRYGPGPTNDAGLISHNSLISHVRGWPQPLEKEAYYGLAGEIVQAIEPHTEADPAALLVQLLVAFGSTVGRGPYFRVEADRHHANLFCCVAGETSKARKGTSGSHVKRVLRAADEDWAASRITNGLSTGEGLIWRVRDAIQEFDPKRQEHIVKDPGIDDKRLFVTEPEFGRVLQVCERQGNTLSPVIRQAWDGDTLRVMTRTAAASSTDAHISLVGHITVGELTRLLTDTQAGNGFANRFLWVCARRSKELPEGGSLRDEDLQPLTARLRQAIEQVRVVGEVKRDESARRVWCEVYGSLSQGQPGLFGSVTSRGEAQTMRLALIYALLDASDLIRTEHLGAALAVWEYAESSARFIFGDSLGDPVADRVLLLLRDKTDGMTLTDIGRGFGGHKGKDQIHRALDSLLGLKRVQKREVDTGGRPAEIWCAVAR